MYIRTVPLKQSIHQILPLLQDVQKQKSFQLQGGFAPLTRGAARWGLRPQTPVIDSRYRARRMCPPTPKLLPTPLNVCTVTSTFCLRVIFETVSLEPSH